MQAYICTNNNSMAATLQCNEIYEVLDKHFPAINNFIETDYEIERSYLLHFGINTKDKLDAFVEKHRDQVMEIDSIMLEPDDEDEETVEEIAYGRDFGDMTQAVGDYCLANNCYYAYPDLLAVAMDTEFEDRFENYLQTNYYDKDIWPEFKVVNITP